MRGPRISYIWTALRDKLDCLIERVESDPQAVGELIRAIPQRGGSREKAVSHVRDKLDRKALFKKYEELRKSGQSDSWSALSHVDRDRMIGQLRELQQILYDCLSSGANQDVASIMSSNTPPSNITWATPRNRR